MTKEYPNAKDLAVNKRDPCKCMVRDVLWKGISYINSLCKMIGIPKFVKILS